MPLYRVIPGLHSEGVRVDEFMSGAPYYKGIKIHPMDDGFEDESSVNPKSHTKNLIKPAKNFLIMKNLSYIIVYNITNICLRKQIGFSRSYLYDRKRC